MRKVMALALVLASLGCDAPASVPVVGAPLPPPASSAPWSRARVAPPSGADAGAPSLAASPDPDALADLIAAAPSRSGAPTGPDGGTLIGSDPRESDDAPSSLAMPLAKAGPHGVVGAGDAFLEPGMSSPSIERAARAGLYWGLVHRCRDPEGKILPPDAIKLELTIDPDGYVAASTILATSLEGRYEEAAQCMRRELSASTFRAPLPAQGMPTRVTMTVPSVD